MIYDGMMVATEIMQAQAADKQERQSLIALADTMSTEAFLSLVEARAARKELMRQRELDERRDERRHQETIAAIRSTSFWRFGS